MRKIKKRVLIKRKIDKRFTYSSGTAYLFAKRKLQLEGQKEGNKRLTLTIIPFVNQVQDKQCGSSKALLSSHQLPTLNKREELKNIYTLQPNH